MTEGPLAKSHREWREKCIAAGTYRPFTDEERRKVEEKWRGIFAKEYPRVEVGKKRRRKA